MLGGFRSRATYSNVVSTLALFLALGGASFAAFQLPRNSVGSKQIKDHAVTLRKVSPAAQRALRGAMGLPRVAGRDGAAIVARVRSTGSVHTPSRPAPRPLTAKPDPSAPARTNGRADRAQEQP